MMLRRSSYDDEISKATLSITGNYNVIYNYWLKVFGYNLCALSHPWAIVIKGVNSSIQASGR